MDANAVIREIEEGQKKVDHVNLLYRKGMLSNEEHEVKAPSPISVTP